VTFVHGARAVQPRVLQRRKARSCVCMKSESASVKSTLILASVPIAWSTYNVAVRILYGLNIPPPAALLNLCNYVVSLSTFQFARFIQSGLGPAQPFADDKLQEQPEDISQAGFKSYALAGLELGLYLFLGSTSQLESLKETSASRAAFLVQTTTIIVPLIQTVLGKESAARILPAAALACAGIFLFSADESLSGLASTALNRGDLYSLAAAFFYSLHVLRLGELSPRLSSTLNLARAKTVCQLGFSSVLTFATSSSAGNYILYLSKLSGSTSSIIVTVAGVLWLGIFTTAYPQWAQSYGQRVISPAVASIVYSTQPLWSALLAFWLLHESLPPKDILAGAAIVAASFLVIRDPVAKQ